MLRYVKGTVGEGLGYNDASYGSDHETKKRRSGYVFLSAGAAVSWGSKLQDVVALSSTEAEYMAMGHTVQEGLYLQMLELEMGIESEKGGTLLLLDDQLAIKLAKNPVFHKRSKHIAIKYHFMREKVENKEFNFAFVRTLSMAADQLTKHVGVMILGVGKTLRGMCSG